MQLAHELTTTLNASNTFHTYDKYAEILSPKVIEQGFQHAGVATIIKRRLPLVTVLWSIIGMSLFRRCTVWDISTQIDIMLLDKKPLNALCAIEQ
ncbi:MAG: transposase domain-containing protein, partial [Paraglaciecola sp.]|nr:transposase domain-containing protein [Paraglaciecola sp.]